MKFLKFGSSSNKSRLVASKETLLTLLNQIITADPYGSRVTTVELYVRNYSVSLKFDSAMNTWESVFAKKGEAVIFMTFQSECELYADLTLNEYGVLSNNASLPKTGNKIKKDQSTLVSNANRSNEVPGKRRYGGSKKDICVMFDYDATTNQVRWDIRSDNIAEIMKSEGYEKAQTVSGPFPLIFICNYLNTARYKVYAPGEEHEEGDTKRTGEHCRGIYDERDFALHLMIYLDHIVSSQKGIQEKIEERDLLYKPKFRSQINLLSLERERILINDGSFRKDEVNIVRVLYPLMQLSIQ